MRVMRGVLFLFFVLCPAGCLAMKKQVTCPEVEPLSSQERDEFRKLREECTMFFGAIDKKLETVLLTKEQEDELARIFDQGPEAVWRWFDQLPLDEIFISRMIKTCTMTCISRLSCTDRN